MGRLDKMYKVVVSDGERQRISFFKTETTAKKYVAGAKVLAKNHNVKIKITGRKPKY